MNNEQLSMNKSRRFFWSLVIGVGLFLLALLPRLFSLGTFLTADEPNWLRRSALFLRALAAGDFAGTLINPTPGVTTLWAGTLGLLARYVWEGGGDLATFLRGASTQIIDIRFVPAVKLPTVFLTAVCVAVFYLLVRRLFGDRIGLVAAILLALDPLYLAHSRILHHDALVTSFMTLSALGAMVYFVGRGPRRYLFLSGAMAGLALLTKTNSLFLAPFVGLTALTGYLGRGRPWWKVRWGEVGRLVADGVIWAAVGAVTFSVVWPAVWVSGLKPLGVMFGGLRTVAGGHRQGGFSWGRLAADPGPLFYPAVLLFKSTPLTLAGAAVAVVAWAGDSWRALRRRGAGRLPGAPVEGAPAARLSLALVVAYVLCYGLSITLVSKKGDRYLLPVFPMLEIVAAVGLCRLAESLRLRLGWLDWRRAVGVAAVVAFQAGFSLPYAPYYLTYYNPALAGWWVAPRWFQLGWGEGLDRAARYLNEKPDAAKLEVVSWFAQQFGPFFRGQTVDLQNVDQALGGEYVVFYVNQVQRQLPAPEVVAYFAQRQPEYVVRLGGMDHAWVYRGPVVGTGEPQPRFSLGGRFADRVALLGYDLDATRDTQHATRDTLHVTLYWRCLSPMSEDYNVYLRLVDGAGHRWGQRDRYPVMGLWGTSRWRPGQVVRDEYRLPVRPGTPPGDYRLEVGLYSLADGRVLPVADGDPTGFGGGLLLGTVRVARAARPPAPGDLGMQRTVRRALGPEIELLGYDFDGGTARPGDRRPLTLYWRAKRKPAADYTPLAQLADAAGTVRRQWPLPLPYPTGRWTRGEVVVQQAELTVPANVPSGQYELRLALSDPGGALLGPEVALGALSVESRQRTFDVPLIPHPLSANFDGKIAFLGYGIRNTQHTTRLTLYWRALSEMDTSYTVFVHVLDTGGRIVAQRDSVPGGGALPTTGWVAGEVIADEVELRLESGTPPGKYTVEVGLYDAATGQRLPVVDDGAAVTLGVVELGAVP